MEILKISSSKLKVMLTAEDMKKYNITSDELDYNDAKTRKKFRDVLDAVKEKCGFDTEGDKVLIQFYPSKDGGCEMFVTKLGILPHSSERSMCKSKRITMLSNLSRIYKFATLGELVLGAKLIKSSDSALKSDIFVNEEGEYYLEIQEQGSFGGGSISPFDRILEYSEKVDRVYYPYITEHCKKLTDGDALKLLLS